MKLILASASPRRKELLAMMTENFTVVVSDADESVESGQAPWEFAVETAEKKALNVAANYPKAAVIGADTAVVCDGEIMGKPVGQDDAVRMLKKLRNRTHEVITGLCIICGGKSFTAYEVTEVEFGNMTDAEIGAYVATGEPMDKAGAYGIQGKAGIFVKGIKGCYFNVVGLPLNALKRLAEQAGIKAVDGGEI